MFNRSRTTTSQLLKNQLKPMQGILSADLSPLNQILVDLVAAIENTQWHPELKEQLINNFSDPIDAFYFLESADQWLPELLNAREENQEEKDDSPVSQVIEGFNNRYTALCQTLWNGYDDILDVYVDKTRAVDGIDKLKTHKGHYYTGFYKDSPGHQEFIVLCERLALMGTDWINLLSSEIEKIKNFSSMDQAHWELIAILYKLFEKAQASESDDSKLKPLKKDIHHLAQALRQPCLIVNNEKFRDLENFEEGMRRYEVVGQNWRTDARVTKKGGVVSLQQQKDRRDKKAIDITAQGVSVVVGISEGAVAGTSVLGVLNGFWKMLAGAVAASGAYCNYYLFRSDIADVLREVLTKKTIPNPKYSEDEDNNDEPRTIRVRRLWINDKNREIGLFRKFLCVVLGAGSIATGAVYACLTFNTWVALLAGGAFASALPFLVMPMAVGFAAVTFLGLTSVLWTGISNLIKNPGKLVTYKQKHFDRRENETAGAYAGRLTLEVLKIALVVGVVGVVTVFTLGLMFKSASELMGPVWALGAAGTDSGVHLPFGMKGVAGPVDAVIEHSGSSAEMENDLNPLQKNSKGAFNSALGWLVAHAVSNGIGQAFLLMSAAAVTASVFGLPFLAIPAVIALAGATKFFYSALPNINAGYGIMKSEQVEPLRMAGTTGRVIAASGMPRELNVGGEDFLHESNPEQVRLPTTPLRPVRPQAVGVEEERVASFGR